MTDRALAVDTSVAVALIVGSHEAHSSVAEWSRGRELHLAGHALAETFAVVTRLPGGVRVAPADAAALIDDNFAEPFLLDPPAQRAVHRDLAHAGISGGAVYDGLVALAARQHGVPLATRDARARATYEALGVDVVIVRSRSAARSVEG